MLGSTESKHHMLISHEINFKVGLFQRDHDTPAHSDYFVLMRRLNTLTHSLTPMSLAVGRTICHSTALCVAP